MKIDVENWLKELTVISRMINAASVEFTVQQWERSDVRLDNDLERGIDVSWDEFEGNEGRLITYKGRNVVAYIRDQYGRPDWEYKFHIIKCSTLTAAHAGNRNKRYVVSTNTDGYFEINIVHQNGHRPEKRRLKVCKHCLKECDYNYKRYRDSSYTEQQQIIDTFDIKEFWEQYCTLRRPINKYEHSDKNTPVNTYTSDWDEVSRRIRQEKNYTCEQCGRRDERHMDVHHINGIKYDNAPNNLMVLCRECHAQQPRHENLRRN
jgi:hypothetical protein